MKPRPTRILLLTVLLLVGRGVYVQDVLRDTGVIVINPSVDYKVYLRILKNGINTNTY